VLGDLERGEYEAFRFLSESMLERAGLGPRKEETVLLLREGKDDWELFPALGTAKRLGALDGLLQLLRWVAPILDGYQKRPDDPLVLNRPTVPSLSRKQRRPIGSNRSSPCGGGGWG